jgi:HAD superfamily hydrolase (TIGR01509 family)
MYKKILLGKKAVLFDLDGTVADTEPIWRIALTNVLTPINLGWFDYDELPFGITTEQKLKYILTRYKEYVEEKQDVKALVLKANAEFIKILETYDLDTKDGFWQLAFELKEQKQLKLGLVTNTPRNLTEKVLTKLGISQTFDIIVTGDEVKKLKPDPEIYNLAAKKLNLNPEEILVFEDSPTGAASADKAKMSLIVIWGGEPNRLQYPKDTLFYFTDFSGLPGNMDTDYEEDIKKAAEIALKAQQEREQTKKSTTPVA